LAPEGIHIALESIRNATRLQVIEALAGAIQVCREEFPTFLQMHNWNFFMSAIADLGSSANETSVQISALTAIINTVSDILRDSRRGPVDLFLFVQTFLKCAIMGWKGMSIYPLSGESEHVLVRTRAL
jgi:hypothetical protein